MYSKAVAVCATIIRRRQDLVGLATQTLLELSNSAESPCPTGNGETLQRSFSAVSTKKGVFSMVLASTLRSMICAIKDSILGFVLKTGLFF